MIETPLKSRNSQRKKDGQMQIVFLALTIFLAMMFLTPFYFLATDPQAPQLFYESSIAENIRISENRDYVTSDWNFTFKVDNTDRVYSFAYESINAKLVDKDGNIIVSADQHPPLLQGSNTETNIVLKFRNSSFHISEWSENGESKGGNASGKAEVKISMRWKLNITGGYKPRWRYTGLNVKCGGSIEFSFNNSQIVYVNFVDEDDDNRCDAHLYRMR